MSDGEKQQKHDTSLDLLPSPLKWIEEEKKCFSHVALMSQKAMDTNDEEREYNLFRFLLVFKSYNSIRTLVFSKDCVCFLREI